MVDNQNRDKIDQKSLPFWRQLRWTLILLFVLLATLPVVIVVAIILNREIIQTREQTIDQLRSVAELKQNQITGWLDDARFTVDLFLAEPARNERFIALADASLRAETGLYLAEQSALNDLLKQAVEANPIFEEMFLYNSEGHIIVASNPTQIGKIMTAQPYFKSSLAGGNFIQTPYYEIGSDDLTMFLTHPLLHEQTRQTVGVLASRLRLDVLGQIMQTGLGETTDTYLVSLSSNYLVTPTRFEDEGYVRNRAYHSYGIDSALAGENGSGLYEDYRDPPVSVFGVYRWIPDIEVALLAEVGETEALAPTIQSRNISLMLAGGIILMAAMIGLFSAARISKPITDLAQVAISVAAGNLNQQAVTGQMNEIGLLTTSFNSMTAQLLTLFESLEEQVASRTQRLEIVASITERVSAILDRDKLLAEVVEQVQARFDYYHAHIYLLDEAGENLVVAEGTGLAGAEMKRTGHSISLHTPTSLVARAARSGQVVQVDNVREAEDWLPNPLLPDTYSEMAVPIILDNRVVGVLDVQDDQIAGLDESDANVLRSLANQVAVAIRNARFFEQVETALLNVRRTQEHYTAQAWENVKLTHTAAEHVYTRPAAPLIDEPILHVAEKRALVQSRPVLASLKSQPSAIPLEAMAKVKQTLLAPVKLGDQVIGALQLHQAFPSGTAEHKLAPWAEDDLAFVEAVLDQVAQTAENLRLFDETQERAGREQVIREITDKLRAAPNLDALLETAAQELGQRLRVKHTVVELGIEREASSNGHAEK